MEHVLSAGDGLYLPFGYWHDVETISNISMHVTIGLDFARKLDAVKLISEELAKDRFFRDKIDYSMTEVEAREFKARLIDVIQDLDLERFLARLRERRLDKEPEFNFPAFQECVVHTEKFDLIKFSSQVRDLLDSELQISVGNMEVVPFAEKLYKLIRAQAYNEGVFDARRVMDRKISDISEQIDTLLQYE